MTSSSTLFVPAFWQLSLSGQRVALQDAVSRGDLQQLKEVGRVVDVRQLSKV